MPPTSWTPSWLFLLLLIPLGGYFLHVVSNMCGAEPPSVKRGIVVSTLVALAAYFTFDLLGYGLVLGLRDITHLILPPGYGYLDWMKEPLHLKWQVMGLVPFLRYLPIVFAYCVATILYIFNLKETYRVCVVILLVQWVLTIVAATAVSAVLNFALPNLIGLFRSSDEQPPMNQPYENPSNRAATRPAQRREAGRQMPPTEEAETPPEGSSLQVVLSRYKAKLEPAAEGAHQYLDAVHRWLEPHLEPIAKAASPFTRHLPEGVQEFLEDDGWTWVLLGFAGASTLGMVSVVRRLRRPKRRRRKKPQATKQEVRIALAEIGDALNYAGPRQVAVRGEPGRLRLVVMAPSKSNPGELHSEMAESVLDLLCQGLGKVHAQDFPRVIVWPPFDSDAGFAEFIGKIVVFPEPAGQPSHWVVLTGGTTHGRQRIHLGVGVYLEKAGQEREVKVANDRWSDHLSLVESTPEF